MKKYVHVLSYFLLTNIVVIIDRVTKHLAITFEGTTASILPGLSFVYVKNRGISWGMFYAHSFPTFVLMSTIVAMVIGVLGAYTYQRWMQNQSIIGEVLVLTGALCNMLDRVLYAGVIDFIEFSYRGWTFPVFNVADVAIVIGVGIMLIGFWRET